MQPFYSTPHKNTIANTCNRLYRQTISGSLNLPCFFARDFRVHAIRAFDKHADFQSLPAAQHRQRVAAQRVVSDAPAILRVAFCDSVTFRDVRSCKIIARITGLTDGSACPTLVRKGLRFCGAGAFACQPFLLHLLSQQAPPYAYFPTSTNGAQ
jgi:hypothetical protein